MKSIDFKERINKRTSLLNEILREIERRKQLAIELSSKDKLLRTSLIRNTEMKSALQNLADIAGYKLNTAESAQFSTSDESTHARVKAANLLLFSQNYPLLLNETMNTSKPRNITSLLANSLADITKNNTYTRYIELAYAEVNNILANDKQTLIEVIRQLKTNEYKLKELDQLKNKVNSSLKRLIEIEYKLNNMIMHDTEIAKTVRQLENKIKKNQLNENTRVLNYSAPVRSTSN